MPRVFFSYYVKAAAASGEFTARINREVAPAALAEGSVLPGRCTKASSGPAPATIDLTSCAWLTSQG
jgi:hypothetical protein